MNLLQLSRQIPRRTHTVKFLWLKKDFMTMTPRYREIRAIYKDKMFECFWCDHPFIDGEMMALTCPTKGNNKMLCQSCANEMEGPTGE